MRDLLAVWLLSLGLMCGGVAADDARTLKTFLFIETAKTAEMDGDVLTLTGIDDSVEVFADRPYRDSGIVSLETFVDAWTEGSDSFDSDPPNAALVGLVDGTATTLIVELGQPQLKEGGISYPFQVINGNVAPTLTDAVIVIDGIDWSNFHCCD